jgi:hypothetical protein
MAIAWKASALVCDDAGLRCWASDDAGRATMLGYDVE